MKRRRVGTAAQTAHSKRIKPKGSPTILRRNNSPKLHQSSVQLAILVQSIKNHAIYMMDKTGRITSWNSGAERIKGYTRDEIIGQHFSRFYMPVMLPPGRLRLSTSRPLRGSAPVAKTIGTAVLTTLAARAAASVSSVMMTAALRRHARYARSSRCVVLHGGDWKRLQCLLMTQSSSGWESHWVMIHAVR